MKKVENYPAKRRAFVCLVLISFWDFAFGMLFITLFLALVGESGLLGFFRDYWIGFIICSIISWFMFWKTRYWFLEFNKYK